jgi:hypothetical protein
VPQLSVAVGTVQVVVAPLFVVLTAMFAGHVIVGAVTSPAQGFIAATFIVKLQVDVLFLASLAV